MNKLATLSGLMCLTTALMATPNIANAIGPDQHDSSTRAQQGNSHPANITKRNGITPHFVISGQPADVKRVLRHRKEKSHKADCRTNYKGIRPLFVISGQPADCKRVLRHRKEKSHEAHCRTNYKGIRPLFVISGQPADCKRVLRHRKEKKSRETDCKTNCYKPTQTTTKGNPTQPTAAGTATPTVSPNGTNGTATMSNGVTTSAMFNALGLKIAL